MVCTGPGLDEADTKAKCFVNDIRLFTENDERFLEQSYNVSAFRSQRGGIRCSLQW